MSSCGGLNQFLTADVPATNGEGADLDVSGLVAQKTVYLSGAFDGEYVILGSHDDIRFIPIAKFTGQDLSFGTSGPQTVKRDVNYTFKTLRVRRAANRSVNISIAGQATCEC